MESALTLSGHARSVLGVAWHKHAENTLASMGQDQTVRIWDVENQKATMMYEEIPNKPTSIKWSGNGKNIAVTDFKGELATFDPRVMGGVLKTSCHIGAKQPKCGWIDDNIIMTTGSNKLNGREFAFWDTRKFENKVAGGALPSGVGISHLYIDDEHKIVYIAYRGDMIIGIFQYNTKDPSNLVLQDNHMSPNPTKGFSLMPKQSMSSTKHEVDRGVRIDNKGNLEYLAFTLANKTGLFQTELY